MNTTVAERIVSEQLDLGESSPRSLPGAQPTVSRLRSIIKFEYVLVALLMLLCGFTAFIYTGCWTSALVSRQSIDYEGHVLWACSTLSQGINIYDISTLYFKPWSVVIYNPLYFVVGAILVKMCGLAYLPLRALSMASCLASLVGMFAILKRSKLNDLYAIVGVCFFATYLQVIHWSAVARVDMFGLAFAVWGVERFLAGLSVQKESKLGINVQSLLLFLAAYFTKQQYFVFPLAVAAYYLSRGESGKGKRYGLFFLLGAAAIAGLIQSATGGYFAHLSYAARLEYDWDTIVACMGPFLQDPKTIAAAFVLVAAYGTSAWKSDVEKLALILLAISLPLALYTMGLRGAWHNHLICIEFALSWLAAVKLSRLSPRFLLMFLLCGAMSLSLYIPVFSNPIEEMQVVHKKSDAIDVRTLNLKGKVVLSEDPSIPMFVGAKPVLIDGTTIFNISRMDNGGLQKILKAINRKEFDAIILNKVDSRKLKARIWPDPVVFAIRRNYKRVGTTWGNANIQDIYVVKKDVRSGPPAIRL